MLPAGILFDLDGTLIAAQGPPENAWRRVIAELAASLAPVPADEAIAAITRFSVEFWENPQRHRVYRQQLANARREIVAGAARALRAAGKPVWDELAGEQLADHFTRVRDEDLYLFDDAHRTLDALRAAGVRLALVTNGGPLSQRPKVERFDLARRFDHVQIEGEHGFGKPEERAYRFAMEALGVEPAHTWMVGDNLEWEVVAPQKLGIHAIWHDSQGTGLPSGTSARPDRIIRGLAELLET